MADQFLTLSLFLMLLSFFIILNSMSEFEVNKSRQALSSLAIAFSNETKREANISPRMDVTKIRSVKQGTSLDQIQSLFTAQVTGIKVAKNRFGTLMRMQLSIEEFESLLSASAQGNAGGTLDDERSLIPTMISLMDSENAVPYRMDILLNTSENPATLQNDNPNQINTMSNKVSSYATRIENMGLSRRLITAGIKQGEAEFVDLVFRRYKPFDPSNRVSQPAEDL